jgi:small subunit ribosomal protein S17
MATDFVGVVTSDKMNKTRRVEIQRLVKHPRYNKYIKRRTVCYAHDEENKTKVGDVVSIKQSRPMSKLKRWVIQEIVRQGTQEVAVKEGAS